VEILWLVVLGLMVWRYCGLLLWRYLGLTLWRYRASLV
jgi:hypothetical protein